MGAPKENQFWKLRKDMTEDGRKLSFEQIVEKTQEYIDYCRNTPIMEVDFKGKDVERVEIPRMRAMTLKGLYHHLGITAETWKQWRKDEKYSEIIARIENLIYVYKFEGAAAGMLNPNLIARELGLGEKSTTEVKITDVSVGFDDDTDGGD